MTEHAKHSALVTGATSGLGFEAAAQLAEAGYAKVTITGRSEESAAAAADRLVERTGADVFETLAVDLNDPASARDAAAELVNRATSIDFLLLNAGMVAGNDQIITPSGVEITISSSLVGHHQLTKALLDADLLAEKARIVIAGSEAARGDVPMFKPIDLPGLAEKSFGGDRVAAARAVIVGAEPAKYKPGNTYATAKMFVAWWAAALDRRLADGMTVNAVSPGSAPDTQADRNANFMMKKVMMPIFKRAPKRFGLSATTEQAAARYLEASNYGDDVSGEFFASPPKKMTGQIERMQYDHFGDIDNQEALWTATENVVADITKPIAA
jgi:NAD(P)-dependent dehydrogenase (short-subunit alcohol dehydrogenase family)